ncbi:MAG: hypothetical protein ACK4IK_08300 [Bacteroidia bacterium]
MKKKIMYVGISLLSFSIFYACGTSKKTEVVSAPIDCSSVNELSYKNDILPILEPNCASSGCHNDKSRKHNISVLNIEDVKNAATKGELLGTIKHEKGYPKMPMFKPKLKNEDIQKIECWVKNGMKD